MVTPITSGEPNYVDTKLNTIDSVEINHAKANMEQRWVSMEGFLAYVDPTMDQDNIQQRIACCPDKHTLGLNGHLTKIPKEKVQKLALFEIVSQPSALGLFMVGLSTHI